MMVEKIRKFRYAQPFKPFWICLRDGRRISIRRWDAFAISPRGDRISTLEPYQSIELDSIVDLTPQKPSRANGRAKRHDP